MASAAPRSPETRKCVKNEAPMRSDSCAASAAELEVRNACPLMSCVASNRKAGRRDPPLARVIAPEEQESRIATRTSARTSASAERSSS